MTQRHLQLQSLHLQKGVQGDLKGPKVNQNLSTMEKLPCLHQREEGLFLFLGVLMIINHLSQQKPLFQFSYQMRAEEKVDGELIWPWFIPCELG